MKNTDSVIALLAQRTRELNTALDELAAVRSALAEYGEFDVTSLREENARLKAENAEMLVFIEALGAAVQEAQNNG